MIAVRAAAATVAYCCGSRCCVSAHSLLNEVHVIASVVVIDAANNRARLPGGSSAAGRGNYVLTTWKESLKCVDDNAMFMRTFDI